MCSKAGNQPRYSPGDLVYDTMWFAYCIVERQRADGMYTLRALNARIAYQGDVVPIEEMEPAHMTFAGIGTMSRMKLREV